MFQCFCSCLPCTVHTKINRMELVLNVVSVTWCCCASSAASKTFPPDLPPWIYSCPPPPPTWEVIKVNCLLAHKLNHHLWSGYYLTNLTPDAANEWGPNSGRVRSSYVEELQGIDFSAPPLSSSTNPFVGSSSSGEPRHSLCPFYSKCSPVCVCVHSHASFHYLPAFFSFFLRTSELNLSCQTLKLFEYCRIFALVFEWVWHQL